MVSEQSVPEVPHTEAAMTEEEERRCMAMLDNLLAVTKKQLGDLTGLAHTMTELKATLQPLVASIRASPPSGTATTSTPVTAMGHAMVAATHSADANSTAKRPARCSTVCLDRDPSVHTWAFTPATTPSAPPTITELDTASSQVVAAQPVVNTFTTDTVLVMPTKCSTEGEEHAIDTNHDVATTGFDTEVPTNCLTKGPRLDANDIGITNLAIVRPAGPEGMLFGFAINDGRTSILDKACLRACSCGAMEFRQPWPPPAQVEIARGGAELRPMPRRFFNCYQDGVPWMPPWPPPQGHGTLLELFTNAEKGVQTVQLAGLWHDNGHGPFSRLLEHAFLHHVVPGLTWSHEHMFALLLGNMVDKRTIDIEADYLKIVKERIIDSSKFAATKSAKEKHFLYVIVANGHKGIDVDKFDYIGCDCRAYDLNSFTVLIVGRLLCGLGSSKAVNRRYISDWVPLRIRLKASAGFVSASALGMALMGQAKNQKVCCPVLAGLPQTKFKIYALTFNQNTLPGWVMCLAWLAYFLWLWISFKELDHITRDNSVNTQSSDSGHGQSDNLGDGLVQPLCIDAKGRQDGNPEYSHKPVTSLAAAYRLLTPYVKVFSGPKFDSLQVLALHTVEASLMVVIGDVVLACIFGFLPFSLELDFVTAETEVLHLLAPTVVLRFCGVLPRIQKPWKCLQFGSDGYGKRVDWTRLLSMKKIVVQLKRGELIDNRAFYTDSRNNKLGIIPIVTSGMVMQLLEIIEVDNSVREDRALLNGAQKLLGILISIGEAVAYVLSGMYGSVSQLGTGNAILIILQFFFADICENIIWKAFSRTTIDSGRGAEFEGVVIALFHLLITRTDKVRALREAFYRHNLPNVTNLLATVLVFHIVIYFQGFLVVLPVRKYSGNFLVNLIGKWKESEYSSHSIPVGSLAYYVTATSSMADVLANPYHALFYGIFVLSACALFSKMHVPLHTRLLKMKQNGCTLVLPKVILLASAELDKLMAKYAVDSLNTKPLKASTLAACPFQTLWSFTTGQC